MLKLFITLINFILIYSLFGKFLYYFSQLLKDSVVFIPLLLGFIAGLPLGHLAWKRYKVHVFEHELTHAIVALLLGGKIGKLVATSHGGWVSHSNVRFGHLGEMMVSFAPYYLPTFTFFLSFFTPFIPMVYRGLYLLILGITLGFHTITTIRETRINFSNKPFKSVGTNESFLSDLGKHGLLFSMISLIALNIISHSIVFIMILHDYSELWNWSKYVFLALWQNLNAIFFYLMHLFELTGTYVSKVVQTSKL
jgi:hypothetical protein